VARACMRATAHLALLTAVLDAVQRG
jgi:hypothetical protein